MPEPPQLAPLDVEEQRLYSELLPSDRAPHPISKGAPHHPAEETHFGRLYPRSCSFGHDKRTRSRIQAACVGLDTSGIKSHRGYYGCDKCLQRGINNNHRMTFPEATATCRTDESFRLGTDEDHHLTQCPLVDTGIDMVAGCPHDYMHLVCLGVVRCLLELWVGTGGSLRTRISSLQASLISGKLLALTHYIPSEFVRRPRALSDRLRWKATELRQFLLFTGPIVLRDVKCMITSCFSLLQSIFWLVHSIVYT